MKVHCCCSVCVPPQEGSALSRSPCQVFTFSSGGCRALLKTQLKLATTALPWRRYQPENRGSWHLTICSQIDDILCMPLVRACKGSIWVHSHTLPYTPIHSLTHAHTHTHTHTPHGFLLTLSLTPLAQTLTALVFELIMHTHNQISFIRY